MSGCPHLSSKSRVCDFREVHKEPDLCKMGVAKESGLGGRMSIHLATRREFICVSRFSSISVPGETVHKLL
ncbi:uncharacterized protein PGTG_21638 [Puccinia graminis f. sp. tritici CRL 75-36-700-3]|uniref:Uncharacterized protein n=1 Tax=Puccinia graminis f. sp. tritici (strain CRL 75-36-700-3 / race SCCL) TaxID=418459 RepID=H6QRP3_PUCGT|nr:uncharacterized protein PGTG_21638 [Puccinia graminis f. sp. tritici CRL 75-36-700-3]EHS63337.1 hypothetical protein PGTG_21638 [Puccinia graminis f. sp. tritici CRL 75-36-700-3]